MPVTPPPAAAAEPAGPIPLAVLPVVVHVGDQKAREGSTLLTSVLATKLAQDGTYRVISADELQELLQNENERQGIGCSDDGCLAELAGALGARLVVTGEVSALDRTLTWSASLVDQHDGEVVRRAMARGASVQALMAQADEMAMALTGKVADTRLTGKRAARRLGLENTEDLKTFRAYRQERPELSTGDAFTQFIVEHNLEHNGMAVAQAVTLVGAAGCIVLMTALAMGSFTASYNFRQPALTILTAAPVLLLGPLGIGLGITGLTLAIVDAFNPGFVKVKKEGCCRDDAEIKDAASKSGLRRASALAILMAGPVQILSQLVVILLYSTTSTAIPALGLGYSTSSPMEASAYLNPLYLVGVYFSSCAYMCTFCISWMPLCLGTTVGALLLLWPSPDPVEDLDDAPPPSAKKGLGT